ncbi:metallophosphoesterase [Frankia sp. CNm7]|uniref:Metallophosphoesterase n=1 Tax=Frankia nepalensis TaxID=1836974 RepID=A0A937UTC6_9ACTN|nr:metallophosphoesterase [Frankia nepalensis]MBL7496228.1 metallophosphoesterase [Frankia nepalensis]MBL7516376.1 metallophosphoesterase [Frankia nepalensis]MBL7519893.1 metallophosphoesterase [Frankia nepalensis]MBL7631125.1 metallophosphoesterase [Frankia nepalensis]
MRGETRKGRPGVRRAAAGIGIAGAAALGYGLYEGSSYTLTKREVPVLAAGEPPLRILHLSDLHVLPREAGKLRFLGELARVVPDLVALTGDVLSHPDASEPLRRALAPLFGFPGVFIPGNNDYYVPTFHSPHRYLRRGAEAPPKGPAMDWAVFARDLAADSGWHEMTHIHEVLMIGGRRLDVRGVDDARLRRDQVSLVAGPPEPGVDLVLGLSHTPEPRVLDAFTADGVQLTLSGHTHGGQLRLPFVGALVTNCGLDTGRARGLSRWHFAPRTGTLRSSWLHVSAGLGTSPFAPVRLLCRPEATLLTLVPAR